MMRTWCSRSRSILLGLFMLSLMFSLSASADISGTVTDPDGAPLEATVVVFEGKIVLDSVNTLSDGVFSFQLPESDYQLLVYSDDPRTDGFDYLPTILNVSGSFNDNISLDYGSSLIFVGDFQFVDTENIPLKTAFTVQNDDGETLVINGYPLDFSDKNSGIYTIYERGLKEVILPADTLVDVNVTSNILIETKINFRGFLLDDFKAPSQGEAVYVDVREYTLPISREITTGKLTDLQARLADMNEYGFYLAKQETALTNGLKYLDDSDILYNNLEYDDSFDSLKRGYILFDHTDSELSSMYLDARFSVYILIAFLTVAAVITGYLFFDELTHQIITDIIVLGAILVFFYYTYPGSRTIPLTNYVLVSVGYLVAFILFGLTLPRFFSAGGPDGRVRTRNLIAPIFNLARRSLRRRRVRFMLTFISITLLVMSFVTLTSFSEGYGLITGTSKPKTGWTGVYIRDGSWTVSEPSFVTTDEAAMNWLTGQPETAYISPKAENPPLTYPLVTVLGQRVYGIIGVTPDEAWFIDIQGTLIEGEMPKGNGVLISQAFADTTRLQVGSDLIIDLREYTVVGIFDDEAFSKLTDLDGTAYAADKWVNTNPEGEVASWVLDEAEPDEILIMDTNAALVFPLVGVQRIAIEINPEYNETGFAERLALERGYMAWANTAEAYTSYRLGNYFQGKGATLVIPWVIVVLNVVVTMLNSLYERRKEIEILSSVGLNPAQVSSIFVAEAAITGFIAGGLGYLVGLGFYKALAILNIGLQVHQKVSAVWSLAAIGLAISAVVTGAFAALQNSVVITPSLQRRWKIDRSIGGFQEPWRVDIPIKLDHGEVEIYLDYMESKLVSLMDHHTYVTSRIKRETENDMPIISFIYKSFQTTTGNFYTRNVLRIIELENGEYGALLESLGETEWVHVAGSLIRRISVDYSTERKG